MQVFCSLGEGMAKRFLIVAGSSSDRQAIHGTWLAAAHTFRAKGDIRLCPEAWRLWIRTGRSWWDDPREGLAPASSSGQWKLSMGLPLSPNRSKAWAGHWCHAARSVGVDATYSGRDKDNMVTRRHDAV
jgi:hypothetical protein